MTPTIAKERTANPVSIVFGSGALNAGKRRLFNDGANSAVMFVVRGHTGSESRPRRLHKTSVRATGTLY